MVNPFEHATPEDFERSSTRDERLFPHAPFDEWVEHYLETARIAYEASEGVVDPWVVLARHEGEQDRRRLFTPEVGETNRDFFARMHREALAMQASRVFVAIISRGAYSQSDDEHPPSIPDLQNRESEFEPIFEESILWYAEAGTVTRYGMVPVHLGRAGEVLENENPDHDGASPLFTTILP